MQVKKYAILIKMTNAIHPKLDHDIVADFEEEDDDPIAALPFKMAQVTC